MNNQNFQGRDLRGRSFAGQTVSDVDFSDCDLRGVDFSETKLTRVKFCRARMGRTWKAKSVVWLLQLVLGVFLSFTSLVTLLILNGTTHELTKVPLRFIEFIYMICVSIVIGMMWKSIRRMKWKYILVTFIILAILMSVMTVSIAVISIAAMVVAASGVVTGVGLMAMILFKGGIYDGGFSEFAFVMIVGVIAINLFGIYLGYRAIRFEEVQIYYIRYFRIKIESLFCTNFSSAILKCVDFEYVDLRGLRFGNIQLAHCNFKQTKNHHLALTVNSPLESRKVRKMVVDGEIVEKNFQNLNLQGLDFSGLELREFDFSNSNISFTNFENCDLRNANLSEVTALGANFNHAKFTGACVKNWNIDKITQLQGVNCDFVYLDSDKKQRNPPEGDFAADEFSKLYQQVADTVDFIANNHEELDALIRAIKTIKEKSGGADIFVQDIQRKEDSVIVKVKAPPEFSKEEIYKEVRKEQKKEIKRIKQEYEQKLLQASSEVKVVRGQNDLLADLLKRLVDRPITVTNTNQLESTGMKTDNSRHFNGSHNENINLGDVRGSTVTQQINQNLPPAAENVELKNLLNEFQALIAKLPAHEQKEAQDEAKKLEEAANKPKEEQESVVRKTLRYFKGLAADLGDLPEIGTQFGEVIAKIGLQFE